VTTSAILVLDILLVLSLLSLAAAALAANNTRRSVILFMAFGLVLALAWGRLQAPDVALAEAAIGAGLSGALLLAAVGDQPRRALVGDTQTVHNRNHSSLKFMFEWTVTLLCVALAGVLAWALAQAFNRAPQDTLAQAVSENLATSGVSNPVTAVLLNFRAYDTLLELAVLLTAVLGIFALGPARRGYRAAGPVFDGLVRWLVPVLILTAGYLLWVGAHAPGGAFQAGATLAAAAVVLRLAGQRTVGLPQGRTLHLVITAGVGMFLVVGLSLLVLGRPFLGYPPAWAGGLILLIETAAMLAIAATLVLAFLGGRPQPPQLNVTGGKPVTASISTLQPRSGEALRGADAPGTESHRHFSEVNRQC
jgi:multisubunit Na+/H+ antiporter MnhB subunit